jgi:hypothetical protein
MKSRVSLAYFKEALVEEALIKKVLVEGDSAQPALIENAEDS